MSQKSDRSIALISIHPQFAKMILHGTKKVEFRKTRFKDDVSHIVLYATFPTKKIIGFFEVENIMIAPPEELWQKYKTIGGIASDIFWKYYESSPIGVAIRIGNIYPFSEPVPLSKINDIKIPPQSFRYLAKDNFEEIKNQASF
jgi:predicted transcriptional regulator